MVKPSETSPTAEEYWADLCRRSPRIWAIPAIVSALVLLELIMLGSGVGLLAPSVDDLLGWGALYGPRVSAGDTWRLATAVGVHIGIFHLLATAWALVALGRVVERLLGGFGILLLACLSGLVAGLVAVVWQPVIVTAGAGAIVFGLWGCLLGFQKSGVVPSSVWRPVRWSLACFVGYHVLQGLVVEQADLLAQSSALLVGVVVGLTGTGSGESEGRTHRRRQWGGFVIAIGVVSVIGFPFATRPMADITAALEEFNETERAVVAVHQSLIANSGEISRVALARAITEQVVGPWNGARLKFERLPDVPADQAHVHRAFLQYMVLREDGWRLLIQAIEADDRSKAEEAEAKHLEAQEALQRARSEL